jgi:hypothetical protein
MSTPKDLMVPENTFGEYTPVNANKGEVPFYWGFNQKIMPDLTLLPSTFPDDMPLHIPRTVRMVYAYDGAPDDYDGNDPDTDPEDCGGVTCAWTLKTNMVVMDGTVQGYYFETGPTVPSTLGSINVTHYPSYEVMVWANFGDRLSEPFVNPADYPTIEAFWAAKSLLYKKYIYVGIITGAPGFTAFGGLRIINWQFLCHQENPLDPDNPIPLLATLVNYGYSFSSGPDNHALLCERVLPSGTASDYPCGVPGQIGCNGLCSSGGGRHCGTSPPPPPPPPP